ncbi:MAG: hypothetical protein AAGJ18_18375 [Bacteroidota bacterium]
MMFNRLGRNDGSSTLLFGAFLLLIPILFSNCKGEGLGFTMTYQRDFEIPAGLGVFDTHVFELNGIPTNKAAFLSTNDAQESDITGIIPRRAELSINFADVDFVFVQEVIVEIFNRNNLRGKEIFFREDIPLNVGFRLDLVPSLPDISEFLMEDEFNVRVELRLRDISPQFIDTRFDFQFFAKLE